MIEPWEWIQAAICGPLALGLIATAFYTILHMTNRRKGETETRGSTNRLPPSEPQDPKYCPDSVCIAAKRNPYTGIMPDAQPQPERVETIQREQPAPEYTPIRGDDVERIKVEDWPIRINNDN